MAITLAVVAGVIAVIVFIRRRWPMQRLNMMTQDGLCDLLATSDIQILDIRDPIDFEAEHHPEAVNKYVGRLPYVSKKELRRDQGIVIVSTSKAHIRRAARILQKDGFTGLSGFEWSSRGACRPTNNHRQLSEAS